MKKIFSILFVLIAFVGCEEEGEPVTLNDLFEANGLPTKRFELSLNGFAFESDVASGIKTNTAVSIDVNGNEVNYTLSFNNIAEGKYLGVVDDSKVFLNYRDANGLLFSSTKQGLISDFEVEVTRFNIEQNVISGNFSGTLYEVRGNSRLKVSNGSFLAVPIVQPLFGAMNATIDNKLFIAESCIFTTNNAGGFVFETFLGLGNKDSTSLNITVEQGIQEQEYQFSAGSLTATYNTNLFSSNIFKNRYDADEGQLTITSIDRQNNRVQGNFNFVVRNAFGEPLDIQRGSFDALIK